MNFVQPLMRCAFLSEMCCIFLIFDLENLDFVFPQNRSKLIIKFGNYFHMVNLMGATPLFAELISTSMLCKNFLTVKS